MIVPSISHYDIPMISPMELGLTVPHVAPRAAGLFAGHEAFGTAEGALNLGNEAGIYCTYT